MIVVKFIMVVNEPAYYQYCDFKVKINHQLYWTDMKGLNLVLVLVFISLDFEMVCTGLTS